MINRIASLCFLAAGLSSSTAAQWLSVGVKGGVPLTDPVKYSDESRKYIVGPSVEFRFTDRLAVEASALYQRIGSHQSFFLASPELYGNQFNRQRGNSWEFPVLGKFYFRGKEAGWQPFLGTGYAFHAAWMKTEGRYVSLLPGPEITRAVTDYRSDYRTGLDVGAVAAAGVRLQRGRLALTPEFRYTRWGSGDSNLRPRNEVNFLFGIAF